MLLLLSNLRTGYGQVILQETDKLIKVKFKKKEEFMACKTKAKAKKKPTKKMKQIYRVH